MSERLPRITGKQLLRALTVIGFSVVRMKGSHAILVDSNREHRVTVPVHAGAIIPTGTLAAIPHDAGIAADQLRNAL